MWDECGKLFGGLWNDIFTNFNFGTEFVMCQSIPNGGGGEVENTNGATGHVPIIDISFFRYCNTQNDN